MSVIRRGSQLGGGTRLPVSRVSDGSAEGEFFTKSPNPSITVDEFRTWLDEKRQKAVWESSETNDDGNPLYSNTYPLQHNWSHRQARQNFSRAKDVDRYFWSQHDNFTTVLLTRTADENTAPLLEQTEALSPDAYTQCRYRLLKRLSSGDYASIVVRAPKYDLPNSDKRVRTHIHEGYWLAGHHSVDDFELLLSKHKEMITGASEAHVSVQHHSADNYPSRSQRFGKDRTRGATTSLPYEIAGANQPLMNVEKDADDLHDSRCLKWCAIFSAGSDGSHSTRGKSYWVERGKFSEYADRVENSLKRQTERDYHRTLSKPYRSQRSETNVMTSLPGKAMR